MHKTVLLLLSLLTTITSSYSQDTTFTYFNTDWDIVQQGEDTVYYRKAIKESNHYTILDYYINDTLQMHGVFSNLEDEIHHGQFSFYHQSGNIQCSGLYQNNKKEGIWTYYHNTAQHPIKKKGGFLNGKKEGLWEYYNNNQENTLRKALNFLNGEKHGTLTTYTSNGHKYTQGSYTNDKKTGKWTFYDSDGYLTSKETYKNDSLITYTFFNKNGKKIKGNPPYKEPISIGTKKVSFNQHIRKDIQYPVDAIDANVEGTVYVSFVIQENGVIDSIKLQNNVHPSLDAEALRVIKEIHKVNPERMHNRTRIQKNRIPIFFKLK